MTTWSALRCALTILPAHQRRLSPPAVFVAGDDEHARKRVVALAKSAGFATVETGGLASARLLEPVAALNIALGYDLGHGTDIAPAWQGVS